MDFHTYFNYKLFKESLKMINPVVLTLILAIVVTATVTNTYFPPGTPQDIQVNIIKSPNPTTNPAQATGAGILNALIFVVLIFIGGIAFIFFIKYGLSKLMNYILAFTFFFAAFGFSDLLLPGLLYPFIVFFNIYVPYNFLDPNGIYILSMSLALGILNLVGFTIIKNQYLHNTLMIMFGIMMGAFFGIFFDSFSLLFVLVALALYDIYAVFRGPLKTMFDNLDIKSEREARSYPSDPVEQESSQTFGTEMKEETIPSKEYMNANNSTKSISQEETLVRSPRKVKNPQISNGFTLPVYATPYITIGLGDFAFFSILIAKVTFLAIKGDFLSLPTPPIGVIYWSIIILPFIGILIGCYLTFVLLQKYEILPALPLPISGGLIGLFAALLLQMVI